MTRLPLKLVLVEDQRSDAILIADALEEAGYALDLTRVDSKEDYVAALADAPELVLCDHALPQFNSMDALKLLQERELDVPFIIISGRIGEEHAVQAIRVGADDYLLKDRLTRLGPAVHAALERRRLRREAHAAAEQLLKARQASDKRYRATFGQSAVGMAHATPEGVLIEVNDRLCEMLGYAPDELIGRSHLEIVHPDDQRVSVEARQELFEAGSASPGVVREKRYVRKNGALIWASTVVSLVREADGAPDYLVAMLQDITERKVAEERFRATFEQAAVGLVHTSLDSRYLMVNQKFCDMVGYTREELLTMRTTDIVHPDDLNQPDERSALLEGCIRTHASERRYVRKDGTLIHVTRTVSLVRDGAGFPLYFLRVVEDVTERRRAQASAALLQATTLAMSRAHDLDAALAGVLQSICESTGWDYGQAWLPTGPSDALECRVARHDGSAEHEAFHRHKPRLVAGQGPGLAKSVFRSGRACCIADIASTEHKFLRRDFALSLGFKSWVGVPVLAGKQPVALLEFFVRDRVTADTQPVNAVTAVGDQLGILFQRKAAEESLRESEERFRQLAGHIPQVFWMVDAEQARTTYVSPAFEQLTGRPASMLASDPEHWFAAVHEEDRERVSYAWRERCAAGTYDVEYRMVHIDGTVRWVQDRAYPVRDAQGQLISVAGITEDITERKRTQEQLLHLAQYDHLTGLPNRVLFHDRLRQVVVHAHRNGWTVGVLSLDVDRFKNVNDTLGHAAGDSLLQQLSERLTRSVRAGDTVGRLGGDEFAVILSNLGAPGDAGLVAQHMLESLREPFGVDGHEVFVTASLGIAVYPADGVEAEALVRGADAAMYGAKAAGRNTVQFYTAAMTDDAISKLQLETRLRRALDRDEFLLHFQPKVDLATQEISGFEALLRWQPPDGAPVSPAVFVPVLEETGLIVHVGEWVLRSACAQIRAWKDARLRQVPVAVNLSAWQLRQSDLCAVVRRALHDHHVQPGLLELEITESAAIQNGETSIAALRELRAAGVRLAIDDFGTGYSSLSYLKRLPVHTVKIDRSFVTDLATHPDDASIAQAIINMAHNLGLKVVAEGVETESQLAFLSSHGCDEIQGYHFSAPVAAPEATEMLRQERRLQRRTSGENDGSRTLLLLDDEENVLLALKRLLRRDGYRIFTATTAQAAFEILATHEVGVIVSDQRMPEVTGVEFLRRVKELYPGAVRMVLSGYTDLDSVTDAINRGAIYRFLTKPWDDNLLRAHIAEAFRRYTAAQEAGLEQRKTQAALAQLTAENRLLRARLGGDVVQPLVQQEKSA